MTRRRAGDEKTPVSNVTVNGGSVYHRGISASGDIRIDGNVEANAKALEIAGEIVVSDALRAKVYDLLAKIAAEGVAGPPVDAAMTGLRKEMAKPKTLRRRVEELLAAIEDHSGKVQLIDAAISAVRLALGS